MGSRLVTPSFCAPALLAAVLVLAWAPTGSAQVLASFETAAPAIGNTISEPTQLTRGLTATWQDRSGWRAGGSIFNPVDFDIDNLGLHNSATTDQSYSFDLKHPSFLTAGLGYRHADGWRFGAEIHFIEMVDTGGLDREGYTTDIDTLAIQWQSAPVIALGGVVPLGDNLSLRSGFTWNRNQVRPLDHAFNAMAPGLMQSSFNIGLQWQWSEKSQWFVNYRSGYADYLPTDATGVPGDFASSRADGILDVVSITFGLDLAL